MSTQSVASSVMSTLSVAYDGKVMTMEMALDENFRGIQRLLNDLHVGMRQAAALTEQQVDDEEDFREAVMYEDRDSDIITQMVRLLEELVPMNIMIRGTAPAGCKDWYKEHKAARKIKLAAEKVEYTAATAKARLALKEFLKAEDTECKSA